MTDEQIAKLYDQALVIENNGDYVAGELDPVKFAKLVAEYEREACAKLIETTDLGGLQDKPKLQNWTAALLLFYAQTIRARGEA